VKTFTKWSCGICFVWGFSLIKCCRNVSTFAEVVTSNVIGVSVWETKTTGGLDQLFFNLVVFVVDLKIGVPRVLMSLLVPILRRSWATLYFDIGVILKFWPHKIRRSTGSEVFLFNIYVCSISYSENIFRSSIQLILGLMKSVFYIPSSGAVKNLSSHLLYYI